MSATVIVCLAFIALLMVYQTVILTLAYTGKLSLTGKPKTTTPAVSSIITAEPFYGSQLSKSAFLRMFAKERAIPVKEFSLHD